MPNQRFYIRHFQGENRWYVFMGNERMDKNGQGLLVANAGYAAAARHTVLAYTEHFNKIVAEAEGSKP